LPLCAAEFQQTRAFTLESSEDYVVQYLGMISGIQRGTDELITLVDEQKVGVIWCTLLGPFLLSHQRCLYLALCSCVVVALLRLAFGAMHIDTRSRFVLIGLTSQHSGLTHPRSVFVLGDAAMR